MNSCLYFRDQKVVSRLHLAARENAVFILGGPQVWLKLPFLWKRRKMDTWQQLLSGEGATLRGSRLGRVLGV